MKKVFITGGNGSIGKSICNIFKLNNYNVIAPSSSELNLLNIADIETYFSHSDKDFDVFIHCAGINNPKLIDEMDIKDLYNTMQINSLSFFHIIKHIIPFQKINGGYILGVSSIYGSISREGRAAYSMSKHSMLGLVQAASIELGKYNIKVNCLSPGFVDTELTRKNNSEEKISKLKNQISLNKLSSVEDIASIAYFLCSSENKYITGQNIIADGGFLCGGFQND